MDNRIVQKVAGKISSSRTKRWLKVLPPRLRDSWDRQFARAYMTRYLRDTLGHFMRDVDDGPFPPSELIMRTFVLDEKDAEKKLNPDHYFSSGTWQMLFWLQLAERYGFKLRTAGAILDFGSGTARMVRHLRCIDGIRLVGTDLYAPNVEWCRQAFPGVEFHQNTEVPPLTFAEDGAFDLVYAASVFTHIPLETQEHWIAEMKRILKPGGFLVCNVLGRYHEEAMLGKDGIAQLHRDGNLTVTKDDANASLATKLIGSWDVFQIRREVLRVFSRHFTVCDYLPSQIDALVLRKPEPLSFGRTTTPAPEEPSTAESRSAGTPGNGFARGGNGQRRARKHSVRGRKH